MLYNCAIVYELSFKCISFDGFNWLEHTSTGISNDTVGLYSEKNVPFAKGSFSTKGLFSNFDLGD